MRGDPCSTDLRFSLLEVGLFGTTVKTVRTARGRPAALTFMFANSEHDVGHEKVKSPERLPHRPGPLPREHRSRGGCEFEFRLLHRNA